MGYFKLSIIGFSIIGVFLLLYFFIAGLLVTKEEIALADLKNSWKKEAVCHESCARARLKLEEVVIGGLNGQNGRLESRIKQYFLSSNISSPFKIELVKVLSRSSGNKKIPNYMRDYLNDPKSVSEIKAVIIASYDISLFDPDFNPEKPLDYYFRLLQDDESLAVKQTVVSVLSNYKSKERYFSLSQLDLLRSLILDKNTPHRLRQSLVLFLNDYYLLFPNQTKLILKLVYDDVVSGRRELNDEVSSVFAVDILNKYRSLQSADRELPFPAVSEEAWNEYYNN